ncbi:MAG: winged helix-turn-helix transcriptional regulator [Thermoplasmata archaeon]
MDEPVLELETARRIYRCINKNPGLHLRKIQRQLDNIPTGTLQYQLTRLEKDNLISSKADGRYKRYYTAGKIGSAGKIILSALRKDVQRRIILYLLLNPGVKHKDILNQFDLSPSTISFHLKNLTKSGITTQRKIGREVEYLVPNENEVVKIIMDHKPTFLDKLVDEFTKVWEELHP